MLVLLLSLTFVGKMAFGGLSLRSEVQNPGQRQGQNCTRICMEKDLTLLSGPLLPALKAEHTAACVFKGRYRPENMKEKVHSRPSS